MSDGEKINKKLVLKENKEEIINNEEDKLVLRKDVADTNADEIRFNRKAAFLKHFKNFSPAKPIPKDVDLSQKQSKAKAFKDTAPVRKNISLRIKRESHLNISFASPDEHFEMTVMGEWKKTHKDFYDEVKRVFKHKYGLELKTYNSVVLLTGESNAVDCSHAIKLCECGRDSTHIDALVALYLPDNNVVYIVPTFLVKQHLTWDESLENVICGVIGRRTARSKEKK